MSYLFYKIGGFHLSDQKKLRPSPDSCFLFAHLLRLMPCRRRQAKHFSHEECLIFYSFTDFMR
jgi:hypothetical protein